MSRNPLAVEKGALPARQTAWLVMAALIGLVLATIHVAAHFGGQIGTCLFHRFTGRPCPFCGTTRALVSAATGHWVDAFIESPLGAVLYPMLWIGAAVAIEHYWRRKPFGVRLPNAVWISLLLALVLNWGYRLLFRS